MHLFYQNAWPFMSILIFPNWQGYLSVSFPIQIHKQLNITCWIMLSFTKGLKCHCLTNYMANRVSSVRLNWNNQPNWINSDFLFDFIFFFVRFGFDFKKFWLFQFNFDKKNIPVKSNWIVTFGCFCMNGYIN